MIYSIDYVTMYMTQEGKKGKGEMEYYMEEAGQLTKYLVTTAPEL